MEQINAYIPEGIFFEEKAESFRRTLHEDSAVVNVRDRFKIISARGSLMRENESLYTLLDQSDASRSRLAKAVASDRSPATVATKEGTLLLFTQPYKETGLVLAVHVNATEKDACAVLDAAYALGSAPVLCTDQTVEDSAVSLERIVEEILYYTNRIFANTPTWDLWMICRLIANFAGCPLCCGDAPSRSLSLSEAERSRLTVFLLAAFLGMHKFIGSTRADAHETPCAEKDTQNTASAVASTGIPSLTD